MIEEQDGWFIVNVKDATWFESSAFGKVGFFGDPSDRSARIGINLRILEPGKPNCRYHREAAQEDFLVLSGSCRLLVNGEERVLNAWDYVHCPPGVSHVFVGNEDDPCAVLMIGHRPEKHDLFYPESELARKYGAESPEPTPDPKVAYADVERPAPMAENPDWPLEQS